MKKIIDICKTISEKAEVYPCTGEAFLVKIPECAENCFNSLCERIVKEYGFYVDASEKGMLFATYAENGVIINISFSEADKIIRLVCEKGENLPPRASEADKETGITPLVTQMRTPYFVCDCGMTYIIRLSDGKFIIIDGGEGEYDEVHKFMGIINAQNERDGVPVVAAWFITHAHSDHFGGFVQACDEYVFTGKLKVERLIYNFAVPEMTCACSPLYDFNRVVAKLENTQKLTARTGQKYHFAGAVCDVLYTCEDLYPTFIRTLNDTSVVFRMEICGKRIMWLGDIMAQGSEFITSHYAEESLKCDIMQVGHHGYWGGSHELHRRINPETLLWPCPDFWYQEIKDWECNKVLKESENIKHIFVSGEEEIVLDMTKPVVKTDVYAKKNEDVIFSANVNGSVMDLHMSCITGGSTGYRSLQMNNDGGKMTFTAGNALSLLESVQPGFTANENKVSFEFSGKMLDGCGKLGLVFNNPHPTVWNEIKALWLENRAGKVFDYSLELDYGNGSGKLYSDGVLVKTLEFVKVERPCGIYVVMKNTALQLERIEFKRIK